MLRQRSRANQAHYRQVNLLRSDALNGQRGVRSVHPRVASTNGVLLYHLARGLMHPPRVKLRSNEHIQLADHFFLNEHHFNAFLQGDRVPKNSRFLRLHRFLFSRLRLIHRPLGFSIQHNLYTQGYNHYVDVHLKLERLRHRRFRVSVQLHQRTRLTLNLIRNLSRLMRRHYQYLLQRDLRDFAMLLHVINGNLTIYLLMSRRVPHGRSRLLGRATDLFTYARSFLRRLRYQFHLFVRRHT